MHLGITETDRETAYFTAERQSSGEPFPKHASDLSSFSKETSSVYVL